MIHRDHGPAVGVACRRHWLSFVVIVLCTTGLGRLSAQESGAALPRVAVEDDGGGSALRLLDEVGSTPVPVAVRVVLPGLPLEGSLDARMVAIGQRRIPLWLSIPAPNAEAEIVAWRSALRRVVERHGSTLAVLEITVDRQPTRVAAFAVEAAATEARASQESVRVALGGEAANDLARRTELYSSDLAPYVDLLSISESRMEGAEAWLQRIDKGARIVLTSGGPTAPGQDSTRMLIDGVVQELGTLVASRSWRSADLTPGALRALAPLSNVLAHEISIVDSESVGLTLRAASQDVSGSLPHRLLFDVDTFSTLLVYWGSPADEPLAISLRLPIEGTPGILDLMTGDRIVAGGYARDQATFRTSSTAPLTGRPMLVNFNEGADPIGAKGGVSAERQLTVGEIISRHQQQQLAQDRLVRNYIAGARMRQYFRPAETDSGYEIVTENRYFVADDGIEWEELSFAVNGRKFNNRPPYPIVQPEQVLSLPLQLRFDEGYRYQLLDTERVDGFDCYRVRFEPVRDDPSLYRGTVWIDRKTFARIRVHAQQGGLPGMVVSNEETLSYAPAATIGNQPVFLLRSMNGSQNMLMAGRTRRIDKSVDFSGFTVNAEDFAEARTTARLSDRIMFRETNGGLRYYVKQGGQRVVDDRPTAGVKAMAIGLIVDPSYAFPLPIFGINYIDFSFGTPNTQLAMLFAGVLAAGNIQHPQFGSKRVDASVDFFAIAAPSSDRVYEPEGELESERLLTWPLSTGLNLGWRATPFQTLTLQYQLRFDGYVRDFTTSESFELPSSTITNGIGGQWEYNRRGYNLLVNGTWFNRGSWKAWGAEQPDGGRLSTPRRYSKFTASISRDFFIDALQKVHVNAAWFGGRDLDRFVKYQFGLFDATRIHGVPSAVRFGELAMARGSYSVNIFDQYRLDLFLDHAWGRDGGDDRDWQSVPGFGVAFNLPGPWNTIIRADAGKSWLPERYGSLGQTSLQIMLLKPLR